MKALGRSSVVRTSDRLGGSRYEVGSTTGSRLFVESTAEVFAISDSESSVITPIDAGVIIPRGESAPVSCAV